MTSHASPAYRLMLAGLPPVDRMRIAAFLRIGSDRLRQHWELVEYGPLHVYMHGADEMPTIPGEVDHAPLMVRVVEADAPAHDDAQRLVRPIQFEALVELLVAAERRFGSSSVDGPRPPSAARSLPPPVPQPQGRYRLRRWPPASELRRARYGQRMASFLSAQYLSAAELAELSGAPKTDCDEFLQALRQQDLLLEASAPSPAMSAALPPHAGAAVPPAETRPTRALLARMRDRLGIRRA